MLRLFAELRQDLGDLLLAGHDLGEEADAVDLAGIVPSGFNQDRRFILGRDRQPVHRLGERLAIEFAELLLGDVFDCVDGGVTFDAVVIRFVVEPFLKFCRELRHRRDRRIGRETDMTLHAVGGIACQLDGLLAEQRGITDERPFESLLARFAHDARALFLVAVDKDRIGVRSLELHDIGGEIHLAGLGRHVGDELDVTFGQLLEQIVTAALAEIVVDPDQRDRLGLELVANVVCDLRHADLLAERGAEQVAIAQSGQLAGFAADQMRDLGLLQHLHGRLDVAGEDRPQDDIGIAVDRFLRLRPGDTGVGLGVQLAERDLLLEDTARGIDLLDRQNDSVAEIAAGHRDASRYLADIDKLHVGGRCAAREQHQRRKHERQLRSSHESLPDDGPFAGLRYYRRSACRKAVTPVTRWADIFRRYSVRPAAPAAGSIGMGYRYPSSGVPQQTSAGCASRSALIAVKTRDRDVHQVEEERTRRSVLIIVGRGPRCLLLQTDYDWPFVPAQPARISRWLNPALLPLRPHRMQDRPEAPTSPSSAFGSTQRSGAGVSELGGTSAGKPLVSSGVASVTTVIEFGESTIVTETPVGSLARTTNESGAIWMSL